MIQFNLVSVTDSASSFSLYFVKQTHLQYKWKPTSFGFAPLPLCVWTQTDTVIKKVFEV